MQFSKNTSTGNNKTLIIKVVLILAIIIGAVVILSKVDFPSPNKAIEKSIPNEKLKIVK
tara:strand:- start:2227 stop:2403 length:177 start_codon:yes stop_codon:yes gene_type:complete